MDRKRRKQHLRSIFAMLILTTLFLSFSPTVKADVPYNTFSVNGFGQTVYTQPAYEPAGALAQDLYLENEEGEMVFSPLRQPRDLYVDSNDEVYIADTGNNRIVHLDANGDLVRYITLPDSPLNQPSGLYVTDDGEIYIADTGNNRVVRLSSDLEILQEFGRPESPYIDDRFIYEPINMIVDARGFVYVISQGTYQGIIQFNPEAEFYGFYGTNVTEVTMMDRVRQLLYTEEQLSRQVRLLPNPITSIDVDANGYIYTLSRDDSGQIKKLNVRGENQWSDFDYDQHVNLTYLRGGNALGRGSVTNLTDISVDDSGIVTTIDRDSATIAQFDQDGELLFFWGAASVSGPAQEGVTRNPRAVDVNSRNELLILDDSLNIVQVLRPSQFGSNIQQAFNFTQRGDYDESENYWSEVVRQNALFTPAYAGLARTASYNDQYEIARELYMRAGDVDGYSDSFWQIRLNWFQERFPIFANAFVIVGFGIILGNQVQKYRRRRDKRLGIVRAKKKKKERDEGNPFIYRLKHAFYILKHPIDGFDELRFNEMGSYPSAFAILGVVALAVVLRLQFTSFTFQPSPPGSIDVGAILLVTGAIWLSWVISHYLIGSIRQGQARFKDVFMGSAYSMFPVVIIGVPLALLSNVMALSEAPFYNAINWFMIIWCAALIFWMVMTLQNYTVGETIISILLSLFAMVILWVLVFILFGLTSETISFLITIYREVTM